LNHSQENFLREIKPTSWSIFLKNGSKSNPDPKNRKYLGGYPIRILSMLTSAACMFWRVEVGDEYGSRLDLESWIWTRDDWIVDFSYPILSCFWKMIHIFNPNPVLVETILPVSENYLKVCCDAQHTFFVLCLFCLTKQKTARVILPLAELDWLM